ncbi:MAG: RlmE family RNA methyltransferase [Planctomycetota bacterium]
MPKRTLHDEFFKRAKQEGYRSRAAYKLKQIQDSKGLIKAGDRVLDLGCAPGAWLQVAAELAGPSGCVVGVDLQPCKGAFEAQVAHRVGDAFETEPGELITLAGGRFDVILSDMAPKTSGVNDHERSVALCQRVLEVAIGSLKPTGHLAMKVFEGGMYKDLLDSTATIFAQVKGFKPKASRGVSREMYIVAKGYVPSPV